MARRWFWLVGLMLLGVPEVSAFPAVTLDAVELRPSMGEAAALTIVAKGTEVEVSVCFQRGAYCAVEVGGQPGFVRGDGLRRVDGGDKRSLAETEAERWSKLDQVRPSLLLDPTTMIVAWGDSLTAGAGVTSGQSYPDVAESLFAFQRDIANEGIGGQTSTAIAARMNAIEMQVSVDGNALPPSGPVRITERNVTPITNQGPASMAVRLCDTEGRLSAATEDGGKTYSYVFSRAVSGDAVPCPAGSVVTFLEGERMRLRTAWLWLGRNGAADGHTIAGDIAAAVASLGHQRFLVGSVLTSAADSEEARRSWLALNAELRKTYGARYVDVLSALFAAADGSDSDAADVRANIVPSSLRSDAAHLNAKGYAIVAQAFHDATVAVLD